MCGPKLDDYCEDRMQEEIKKVVNFACACCDCTLYFDSNEGYHVKNKKRWCNRCYATGHADTMPDVCPCLPNIKKMHRLFDTVELTLAEADVICNYVRSRARRR